MLHYTMYPVCDGGFVRLDFFILTKLVEHFSNPTNEDKSLRYQCAPTEMADAGPAVSEARPVLDGSTAVLSGVSATIDERRLDNPG